MASGRNGGTFEITQAAVRAQVEAMGAEVFEVGLFRPDNLTTPADGPPMLPRTWDLPGLMRSIPWLRLQNMQGRNIYVRPRGEHNLSLVDDLKPGAVEGMKNAGFAPALVIETSPRNYQAWVKHPEVLSKETGTAAARALARLFDGDSGAAAWRQFGRLAGFTNRKPRHQGPDGLYPFVRVVEASGVVYPAAARFLRDVRADVEASDRARLERLQNSGITAGPPGKGIEAFRANPVYNGDGTRIDLAYAIYAIAHGVPDSEVGAAIRSRDLSHKGNERRQNDYVERTIKKAQELLGRQLSRGIGR
jgi:hypothetical protein